MIVSLKNHKIKNWEKFDIPNTDDLEKTIYEAVRKIYIILTDENHTYQVDYLKNGNGWINIIRNELSPKTKFKAWWSDDNVGSYWFSIPFILSEQND